MAVHTYRDLHAWKMARELADRILVISRRSEWRNDRYLASQLQRSAQSVCANIAEGFGRFTPGDFSRFLRIAKGSAYELQEHIHHARVCELLTEEEVEQLETLCRRTVGSIVPLLNHLEGKRERKTHAP